MSKIYKVTNSKTGEDLLLVSKEYVDLRLKSIRDALVNHIKDIEEAHNKDNGAYNANDVLSLLDNAEYVDITDVNEIDVSDATQIKQDSAHRFITDEQLKSLNSKASVFEVKELINDAKNELQVVFNDQYIRLLNNQDIIQKLRELSELVKDDVNIDNILKALDLKLSKEDLEEHAKMHTHLSSEDREALDVLMDKYESGDLESIGVKSIHADVAKTAMNALSLDNLNLDDLRKARREDVIIGKSSDYNKNELDLVIDGTYDFDDFFNNMDGIVLFKNGVYKINLVANHRIKHIKNTHPKDLSIEGCGIGTVFELDKCDLNYHITIKNCTIRNRSNDRIGIGIGSYVKFDNVQFENCDIIFKDSVCSSIRNCRLINSEIKFSGVNTYLYITDNYLDHSKINKYISKNIILRDNIDIQ